MLLSTGRPPVERGSVCTLPEQVDEQRSSATCAEELRIIIICEHYKHLHNLLWTRVKKKKKKSNVQYFLSVFFRRKSPSSPHTEERRDDALVW